MAGFTDEELFGAGARQSQGFTDAELEVPATSIMQAPGELGRRFVRGAKDTTGTMLQGIAEAIPPDIGNAKRAHSGQLLLKGIAKSYDEAVAMTEAAFERGEIGEPKATDTLLHQAGTGLKDLGKDALSSAPGWEKSVTGDIAAGFGSVAANIGPALLGGPGRAAATIAMPFGGAGEAAERARTAQQSEEMVRQTAQAGLLAGATDLVDLALLRSGIGGASASRARRAITRLVNGGLVEGTQEGIQQFIQNAIAKGYYKPDQDLSEDVLYNAFIGSIVGGGTALAVGGRGQGTGPAPSEQDIDAVVRGMNSGVPQPPPGGVPPPPAAAGLTDGQLDIPPASGPEDFGLGPTPASGQVEVRQEGGMWNVYIDGGIENAFGAKSDADRWVADYYKSHGITVPGATKSVATPDQPADAALGTIAGLSRPVPIATPPEGGPVPVTSGPLGPIPDPAPSLPPSSPSKTDTVMTPWGPQELPLREEIGDVRANPTPNKDMTRLLGMNQYGDPTDMFRVAVKEMYQNSFDAVKGVLETGAVKEGKIDISIDDATHTVSVRDNGAGVSLDVLVGPFFSPGGTHKTTKRPSGGFGIAKLAFQNPSESFHVVTMSKDGIVSEVVTSGAAIQDFLENTDENGKPKNPDSAPLIRRRKATAQDRALFPEGHGTLVEAKLPAQYLDPSTHEMKRIPTLKHMAYHPSLIYSPLFDNITVNYNGAPVAAGKNFQKQDYTPAKTFKAGWGTIRVLRSNMEKPPGFNSYANAQVLSNGLFQFSTAVGDHTKAVPYNFYFDIQPSGDTRTPGYPFTLNRQGFSPAVEKDIEQIIGYLDAQYKLEKMKENFTAFGDMQYMKMEADGTITLSSKTKIELTAPLPDTAFKKIALGGTVDVKDGKLIQNGQELPSMNIADIEKSGHGFSAKDVTVDQSKINVNFPILHDNVDVVISDQQVVPITELMREKYGAAFDNYVFTVGNIFLKLRNIVADEMDKHFPQPQWGLKKTYNNLKKNASGISFDIKYRGVSMRIPFAAEFLNIAVPEKMDSPEVAGFALFGTMVHELAHFQERNEMVGHGPFAAEMQRITYILSTSPTFLRSGLLSDLLNAVQQNWEMQQYMHGVISSGTYDTRARDKRVEDRGQSTTSSVDATDLAETSGRRGDGREISGRSAEGTGNVVEQSELGLLYQGVERDAGSPKFRDTLGSQRSNARALNAEASAANDGHTGNIGDEIAVPTQPTFDTTRKNLDTLFSTVGGTPAPVKAAASHADRMNRWYQWMAGLMQLQKANPAFLPLRNYVSGVQLMHNEEARIQDAALRVAKRWRSLGDQGERLAAMFDDVANMRYRTSDEVRRGIQRHPTTPELQALVRKHRLDAEGLKVFEQVRKMFDGFLELIKANAFAAANRIITDPIRLAQKLNEIQAEIDSLRARPYFPLMRFGRHFIMKKDAAGNVVHFETFERRGLRSAQSVQMAMKKKLQSTALPGEVVTNGIMPEVGAPFIGLPNTLLEQLKATPGIGLTPDQLTAIEQIQLLNSPALSFKRMMKSDYVPGYSSDFKRAFARYFFHGGRYYARTKYGTDLNAHIAAAQAVPHNKANLIAQYMRDHLQNTILDAKGDFGIFKAGIFIWVLGYVPAAATMNLLQTPTVTYSHLAGKFGGLGLGNARAGKAIIKAATNVKNFYRRGEIEKMTGFEYESLSYGIKTGRVSETQAAELAGISAGDSLIKGIAGNRSERAWIAIMERSALMFELAEQFNRRVAWRAAMDLAQKYPNSRAVKEATKLYEAEYQSLQVASGTGPSARRAFTPAEAAAIVTAAHTVDQTQFVYARYDRPRFMRGRLPGTLFVFKKYLQSMLFWMFQNKKDVLPQYILVMALLGGQSGLPGYDDLRDLLRAFTKWWFGKDFNLDRVTREFIVDMFGGKVPPDLVLHGLARVGFGIPALMDLMGSFVTGTPGRGLQTNISSDPSNPQGRGANVPFPVLDRHRALSLGNVLPFEPGKLLLPQSDRDLDHTMAEQAQKASGAVFGIGWNAFKMLHSEHSWSDFKKYEKAIPRSLGALSQAYRAFTEGRERGRGGPNSAPTIIPYDIRDPEQMMEIIFKIGGYQTLRQQARWDNILAKVELEKFYDGKKSGLLSQYNEALSGGNQTEMDRVMEAMQEYNAGLPDWASGRAISSDGLRDSMKQRARVRELREQGLPTQKGNFGISDHIDRLFPEGTVDARRVR